VSSVFASIPEFLGSGSEDQDHIREGTEEIAVEERRGASDHLENGGAVSKGLPRISAPSNWSSDPPLRDRWFADSLLEGDGFELSVPRVMGGRFRTTSY